MKKVSAFILLMLFLGGCSAYKQLEPDPELSGIERGYIELKNDDEFFELEPDNKYFIQFPAPADNGSYLVLSTQEKSMLEAYLTDGFVNDDEAEMPQLEQQRSANDSLLVYEVNASQPAYHFVIESVSEEILLKLDYRYAPQWRFNFEMAHEEYSRDLEENRIDRAVYNKIDMDYSFEGFDFTNALNEIERKLANLNTLQEEVVELEDVFPSSIVNSSDSAYTDYATLLDDVNEEIRFQNNYRVVLTIFKSDLETQDNIEDFFRIAPDAIEFFELEGDLSNDVIEKARRDFQKRLEKAVAFYDEQIRRKANAKPLELEPPFEPVEELYRKVTNNKLPPDFAELAAFYHQFNEEAEALLKANEVEARIDELFKTTGNWPSNDFYDQAIDIISEANSILPASSKVTGMSKYGSYRCSELLSREINTEKAKVSDLVNKYKRADRLVAQINQMKARQDYKGIIGLLNQNRDLFFLLEQYSNVDDLSIAAQEKEIANLLAAANLGAAENKIEALYRDENFLNPTGARSRKMQAVRRYEDALYVRVKEESKKAVDTFVAKHETTIDNVEGLYQDSVFTPIYQLTFASAGQETLNRRRSEISDYLTTMKHITLPENAITAIYQDFIRNINNRGVEKCRAIAVHGRNYKGEDRKIKNIADECDVDVAKWITKPKEYRRVFALPVTTKKGGTNQYKFRMVLQIPSEAEFPVFEINMKLPEAVASNAGAQQWYDIMTLNQKELRNEGRIKITSPTAANGFEAQVSPVQMDKDGTNILEVRFTYPDFRVFEVSVMAQKPIIKKN